MTMRREAGQRPSAGTGKGRSARRLGVAAIVALSGLGIAAAPVTAQAPPAFTPPAGTAATTRAATPGTLTLVRTLDRVVTSWGPGTGTDEAFSTPAVADLNHDGTPEIVVASNDGVVTAWRTNGTVLWATNVGGAVDSSPTVTDINGDGNKDVLVGTMAGTVVYLNGPNGAIVHTFHDTPSSACAPGVYCKPRGFFATPVAADLDGDGKPEIIAASWDHQVYAWHRDGTPYFRVFVRDTIWSSPTVVDINGDGKKEIIFGGDRTGDPDGGYLWMLHYNGSVVAGFPKILAGQTIWSSPSVADIDGDRKLDIVVGTGLNYPRPAGEEMYAFDSSGNLKPGWPVAMPGRVIASPAIGDINNDGKPEIVAASEGGDISAFTAHGTNLWTRCNTYVTTSCSPTYPVHGQATLADVDDNGSVDVVSTMEGVLRVRRGSDGTDEWEGHLGSGFPPSGGATVAEVGGKTWIVQSVLIDRNGDKKRDAGDLLRTYIFTTGTALGEAPWPTFRHDAARTGYDLTGTEPWYPFSSATALVDQQYRDLLNRDPDPAGAKYWADRLVAGTISGASVIEAFLDSPEFGTALAPAVRAHLALNGKMPDTYDQLQSELTALRNGTTEASIADGLVAGNDTYSSESDSDFVNRIYTNAWGAAPTDSQSSAATSALGGGTSRGTELEAIVEQAWPKAVLNARVIVIMTYVGMLRRLPDGSGYNYWVTKVRGGTSPVLLARQFQYSAEYIHRFR